MQPIGFELSKVVLVLQYVTEEDLASAEDRSNVVVKTFENGEIFGQHVLDILQMTCGIDLSQKDVFITGPEGGKVDPLRNYSKKQVGGMHGWCFVVLCCGGVAMM